MRTEPGLSHSTYNPHMRYRMLAAWCTAGVLTVAGAAAQAPGPAGARQALDEIRREGLERSQVMRAFDANLGGAVTETFKLDGLAAALDEACEQK